MTEKLAGLFVLFALAVLWPAGAGAGAGTPVSEHPVLRLPNSDPDAALPGQKPPPGCYDSWTGRMANYKQCDPRWGCYSLAGHKGFSSCNTSSCKKGEDGWFATICESGCGVTSSAIVLTYYGLQVTPIDVAAWLIDRGYRDDLGSTPGATCIGVDHTGMCAVARWKGFECAESSSFEDLDAWLEEGPVIANVEHRNGTARTSCKFTTFGHYIVLTGRSADGSSYEVSDPAACNNETRAHATRADLAVQCSLAGFLRFSRRNGSAAAAAAFLV